jgi:hypothetical protein
VTSVEDFSNTALFLYKIPKDLYTPVKLPSQNSLVSPLETTLPSNTAFTAFTALTPSSSHLKRLTVFISFTLHLTPHIKSSSKVTVAFFPHRFLLKRRI